MEDAHMVKIAVLYMIGTNCVRKTAAKVRAKARERKAKTKIAVASLDNEKVALKLVIIAMVARASRLVNRMEAHNAILVVYAERCVTVCIFQTRRAKTHEAAHPVEKRIVHFV